MQLHKFKNEENTNYSSQNDSAAKLFEVCECQTDKENCTFVHLNLRNAPIPELYLVFNNNMLSKMFESNVWKLYD